MFVRIYDPSYTLEQTRQVWRQERKRVPPHVTAPREYISNNLRMLKLLVHNILPFDRKLVGKANRSSVLREIRQFVSLAFAGLSASFRLIFRSPKWEPGRLATYAVCNNLSSSYIFSVQPGFPRSVGARGRRLAVQGRRGRGSWRRRWRSWRRRQQDGLRPRQRPVRLTVWDGPTGQGGRSPHPGFLSAFLGRTSPAPPTIKATYTSTGCRGIAAENCRQVSRRPCVGIRYSEAPGRDTSPRRRIARINAIRNLCVRKVAFLWTPWWFGIWKENGFNLTPSRWKMRTIAKVLIV